MKLNTTAKLLIAFLLAVIAQLFGRSFYPLLAPVFTRCLALLQGAVSGLYAFCAALVRAFASLLEQFRREGELLRK
jgi:hypothetical protein